MLRSRAAYRIDVNDEYCFITFHFKKRKVICLKAIPVTGLGGL
jgi:hypothetical protein